LALPDTIEHVALISALAKIGAISFPINAQLLRSEDEVGLGKHQLKAVIAVEGAPALPEGSRVFFLGKLFARAPHLEPPTTAPGGEHPLCCTQSPGTTGTAKAFLKSHDQTIAAFHSDESSLCWTAADRYLALISLSFSASSRNCLAALRAGTTIILDHSELVRERIRTLQDKRVTVTTLTPHHLCLLLAYVMRDKSADTALLHPLMRSMRVVTAAITAPELAAARAHLTENLFIVYGANELSWIAMAAPADQDAYPGTVGRPVPGGPNGNCRYKKPPTQAVGRNRPASRSLDLCRNRVSRQSASGCACFSWRLVLSHGSGDHKRRRLHLPQGPRR
jgi:acyl-CoA synthetase (AMP-forming)/AMP-acid ligase II